MDGREHCIQPEQGIPEQGIELEQAPHAPIALFDEHGKLQGWSPAFADACAQSSIEFRNCRVGDFWPEFDARRWADIWRKTQSDGSATVVHVLARNRRSDHSEMVELEIGRFIAQGMPLARIEIRRAAWRRLQLLQQEILEAMANGVPMKDIMDTLCRRVEALAPSVLCSVLAVNRDQQLQPSGEPEHCAALLQCHRRHAHRSHGRLVRNGRISRRAGRGHRHRHRSVVGRLQASGAAARIACLLVEPDQGERRGVS